MRSRWNISLFVLLAFSLFSIILLSRPVDASSVRPTLDAQYAISRARGEHEQAFHVWTKEGQTSLENNNQDFSAVLFVYGGLKIMHQGHYIALRLASVASGNKTILPEEPTHVEQAANRIVYEQGFLKQWFVNGPMGLQQGFTLEKRPSTTTTGNLVVSLEMEGDLFPRLAADGRGVDFIAPDKSVALQYTGLMVVDANDRLLPARMEVNRNRIDIVVNDRDAVYPVIIDPIFQQAKLTASDGAGGDNLGHAVAIDGDIIAVGAPESNIEGKDNQGAVYVYKKSGSTWMNMTQIAKLTASNGKSGDNFGSCVAISKNVIAVGAPHHDTEGHNDQGAVYVYVRPSSGWESSSETARMTASDGEKYAHFGDSIAIDQDTIVVGDAQADINGVGDDKGAAYVFIKPVTGGWVTDLRVSPATCLATTSRPRRRLSRRPT